MRFDIWQDRRENKNNKHYEDKNGNLAVNVFSEMVGDKPVVAMFVGKALKPRHYYRFQNEIEATRFIKNHVEFYLKNINDRIDSKQAEKELKKNYKTSLKVGDIMHGSWGYDMTINEFYQIIEIRNRTVILQEIGTLKKAMGHLDYDVKPRADYFIGEPIKRILQVRFYNDKPFEYIKLNEVCDLTLCEDTNRYYYENHWD